MSEKETPSQLVYSLWKVGRSSFERAEKLNGELAKTTGTLNEIARLLPAAVSAKVDATMPKIAGDAAKMIASEWTDANEHAEKATEAYREATADARKAVFTWAGTLFGALALVILILVFWILPNSKELAGMQAEKAQLEFTLGQLTKQGARANVVPCLDANGHDRLCVQIDESARVPKGLQVIKGY